MIHFSDDQNSVLEDAIKTFGKRVQYDQAVEELTELSLKIQHGVKRGFDESEVSSEIADVFVMCQQLAMMHGFEKVQEMVDYKINRLRGRILDFNELTD